MLFLDLGLGYTASKLLGYLIFPILGIIVWLLVRKRLKAKWLRVISFFVAILLPFGIYFALYPIYEGDFSNNSVLVTGQNELDKVESPKLVIISIPNCPFCRQSVDRMRALQKRHPEVKIEYRVCVNDSLADEAVKMYRQLSNNELDIRPADDRKQLADVAEMAFPTFVLVEKDKKLKWSNDNFGAGALDEVVAAFEK